VSYTAEGTIKSIEAAVIKNNRQPAEVALLRRAEALQTSAKYLISKLRASGDQLRRTTDNKTDRPLQHPDAAIGAKWAADAPQQQALARQLAAYANTLHRYQVTDAQKALLSAPAFAESKPVAEALADLTQLESEILACQTHALQRISQRVGAPRWVSHPLAFATAQANVVAPGDTYRAQLGLIGYLSAKEVKMQMACNGRPVPADSAGVGQVRFRAPTRPGPATWTGTIRLNHNGRDTTFRVTVPYRVARR
ncbi:MAG TPA: hypothetical protein VFO93_21020, partial [Hymenobacter sp.]|nr:hypothetical protein [Hymenobacter sp.]